MTARQRSNPRNARTRARARSTPRDDSARDNRRGGQDREARGEPRGNSGAPKASPPKQGSGKKPQANRGRGRKARRRGQSQPDQTRSTGAEVVAFWGDAEALPAVRTDIRITDDPAAVPRSLGRPPLPGHEQIAEHYFTAVYDRAVATAGALAAAGGLIDAETLAEEYGN